MRFITEFEFKHAHSSWDVDNRRKHYSILLGEKIAEVFGWQEEGTHSKLEIEAFPANKWVEFRKALFDALPQYDQTAKIRILNALAQLEHPIKPSGDAITNQQLNK